MLLAFFSMAFCDGNQGVLYIRTAAIIGMPSGALTSVAFVTSSELFRILHCSVNHNILLSIVAIASFIFHEMAEMLYDHHGNMNSNLEMMCMGRDFLATSVFSWDSCERDFGAENMERIGSFVWDAK